MYWLGCQSLNNGYLERLFSILNRKIITMGKRKLAFYFFMIWMMSKEGMIKQLKFECEVNIGCHFLSDLDWHKLCRPLIQGCMPHWFVRDIYPTHGYPLWLFSVNVELIATLTFSQITQAMPGGYAVHCSMPNNWMLPNLAQKHNIYEKSF